MFYPGVFTTTAFSLFYINSTVKTCTMTKTSNESFKRPFNTCMKRAETQGCESDVAKGRVTGGAASQGTGPALQTLCSAFLEGFLSA